MMKNFLAFSAGRRAASGRHLEALPVPTTLNDTLDRLLERQNLAGTRRQ